jgi:hypothetical protein
VRDERAFAGSRPPVPPSARWSITDLDDFAIEATTPDENPLEAFSVAAPPQRRVALAVREELFAWLMMHKSAQM